MHKISYYPSTQILKQFGRLNFLSSCYFKIPFELKCPRSIYCTVHHIICTDTRHQRPNTLQYKHDFISEQETVCCYSPFLKENFNIVDYRYFKIVSIPNECYVEELLKRNELKEILSRSSFTFDVDLPRTSNPRNFPVPSISVEPFDDTNNHESFITNCIDKSHIYKENLCSISDTSANDDNKPTEQQLLHIINKLTYSLLNFFEKPQDYSIFHKNIVFQNHIRGITTKGLTAYIQAMYVLKFYGLFHYAKVKVEILKITHHVEDGTVRVRWRVNGITRQQVLMNLWRTKKIKAIEFSENETEWLDGFSIFSVGPDGLVFKHVCDKLTPSHEEAKPKKSLKSKLLRLIELSPRGPAGSLHTLMSCYKNDDHTNYKKHL